MYDFTNCFCIYADFDQQDDEELERNIALKQYDPVNSNDDLLAIVELGVESLSYILNISYRHAYLAVEFLDEAIRKEDMTYSKYFEDSVDDVDVYIPWHLNNERAKEYFELLLSRLKVEWKDAIEKASKEDPSTW